MYKDRLRNKIYSGEDLSIDCPEEYYYLLGQIIVYVFEKLGGADKYRREFSYLTCPVVPCDAKRLNKRAIHFLENVPRLLGSIDPKIRKVIDELLSWDYIHREHQINLKICEEAFYDGVYEENFL